MSNSSVWAVIPARGGSKGIPRKNVAWLCGKPLIVWTIEAAQQAKRIDRVIVSTDDEEIARTAERAGAEVVRRPEELSGDQATSETALLHALETLGRAESPLPELLVFLQCTAPLMLPEDIDGTVAALKQNNADTALAVAPFHYFLWRVDADGQAEGINHDRRQRLLRQQRAPEYIEAGSIYVMRTSGFLETKHRFFGRTVLHEIPAERCWEIDDPVDLRVAEVLLRQREQERKAQLLPNPPAAVVFDFDGVFTDNRVYVAQDGTEAVACNRSDGMGIDRLKQTGLPVLVLSTEANPVVSARCAKLGIECLQGCADKARVLSDWLGKHDIDPSRIVYVGNDINDVECLKLAGCGIVVADAHPDTLPYAQLVLDHSGGAGAVREVVDLLLAQVQQQQSAGQGASE